MAKQTNPEEDPSSVFREIREALAEKASQQDAMLQAEEDAAESDSPVQASSDQKKAKQPKKPKKTSAGPKTPPAPPAPPTLPEPIASENKSSTQEKFLEQSEKLKHSLQTGYARSLSFAQHAGTKVHDAIAYDSDSEDADLTPISQLPPPKPEPEHKPRPKLEGFTLMRTILLGSTALIVLIVGSIAYHTLLQPIDSYRAADYETARNAGFSKPTPETAEVPQTDSPKVTKIDVISLGGGDGDHPEMTGRLLDGDPNSLWRSRYFGRSSYANDGVYLVVHLEKPARVSTVDLTSPAQGGTIHFLDPASADPKAGGVLARATFTDSFQLKLDKPILTDHFTLRIAELPKDREGRNRAWLGTLTVK
ncbi:hypothetical protein [Boudabousia marimammalium]|uniref:Uncharacterized protein n=1 Tax=Boudabousia marimammalium TaxID=156892 RepID=A0A1Q5PSM1_9ACTO|nr:hypothetical protein [Boudabousia marimammalium]OKL50571.1 hypothetical protein BM477_01005 [Boudabousia marimammalium]